MGDKAAHLTCYWRGGAQLALGLHATFCVVKAVFGCRHLSCRHVVTGCFKVVVRAVRGLGGVDDRGVSSGKAHELPFCRDGARHSSGLTLGGSMNEHATNVDGWRSFGADDECRNGERTNQTHLEHRLR